MSIYMMKISAAVLAAVMLVCICSGCGSHPVDKQEFEALMLEEGFEISEKTENYAAWSAVYAAEGVSDAGTEILWLTAADETEAGQLYSFMKNDIRLKHSDPAAESEISGSHRGRYFAVTQNAAVMTAYSGRYFILCSGAHGDAGKLKKLAAQLGF